MRHWEANWNRDVLERAVVLLFALANLADLAADASYLRRRRVLGILNCGEVEARAFFIEVATGATVSPDALEPTGDAARLAVRLRALALLLCAMLAGRFALPGATYPQAGRPGCTLSGPAVRRPVASPIPDTS
jgi:hypothetical protein